MKQSESINEIATALVKAQAAIGAVLKDKTGKIETKSGKGYEYNYSDLASVIEAIKKPLNDCGIAFVQGVGKSETGALVTTMLLHISGQWLSEETYIPVAQTTPQAFGSAITYAKRYGLQAFTGLPSEDDDGKKGGEKDAAAHKMKPNALADWCIAIDAQTGLEDLQKTYTAAVLQCRELGDAEAEATIKNAKDARKITLTERKAA